MVPKVAAKGNSFKGAGLYYLHDKKAATAKRVAFTLTENLPTDNPERALRLMAYTALRQGELKAANAGARTGRKLGKPVYTYSLSWAPDEKPTQAEMIEAGRETLKILGLGAHEVLMVAHSDEPHPHLHLIINRVHPDTGKAAVLSNDHLALSKWAEAYERKHGKIRCEERVKNNEKRRQLKAKGLNGFVKHRDEINSADFRRWLRAQSTEALQRGPVLELNIPEHHRGQRRALHDAREQRITQRRQQIREINRPKWAFLFRQQDSEKRELDQTRRNAFSRLLYWVQHRQDIKTRGGFAGAFSALLGHYGPDFADAMHKRHEADRKALGRRVDREMREAIAQENELHRTELDALKHGQAAELQTLREAYDQQRGDSARGTGEAGSDKELSKEEAEQKRAETLAKPVREQFEERVRKRAKRARKRDERGKGKDQGRERE